MRVVIQRVAQASVAIDQKEKSQISLGLLIFVGFENSDQNEDIHWIVSKIANLRIFDDATGKMNLSVKEVDGNVIIVSQFTLHASTKKGNRPSYIRAAKPEIAEPMYEGFIHEMEKELGKSVQTGEFGASMKVSLVNDGPVTISIDTKQKD